MILVRLRALKVQKRRAQFVLKRSVGLSVQYGAMDVARSAPQRAHYHADIIYLPPLTVVCPQIARNRLAA